MAFNYKMMMLAFGIILINLTLVLGSDHYWRDYNGTIPTDALVEVDTNLVISQISTVKECGGLVPAGLNRFTKVAETECGGRMGKTNHIKVLCTQHPERYYWEWKNVSLLLAHDNLVVVGYEDAVDDLLYIGKIFKNGAWNIGKVFLNRMRVGLFFNAADGAQFTATYFMILKYR